MSNVYACTALTGGASGALDSIDGADLSDLDAAMVTTVDGVFHYSLDADSGLSESSPTVISPDANAGTKRWILVSGQGGGLSYEVITASQTAELSTGYLLNPSADLTLTLPASPDEGDTVGVVDAYEKASTYTLTVARNGSNIEGAAEDLVLDIDGSGFTLVYADATRGWEIVSEIGGQFTTTFNYANYVDRGDPAGWDFETADFTTDATWNDLDLSSILPSNATAVYLRIQIEDGTVENFVRFRENGNSNIYGCPSVRVQAANVLIEDTMIVSCDSSQIIEYQATNTTFTSIKMCILGWYTANDEVASGYSATTFDYQNFVDRGDPSTTDFAVGDLTTDATWYDLDLSTIVPSDAVAVSLRCYVKDDVAGSYIYFRKNGNTNSETALGIVVPVANVGIAAQVIVPCDSSQIIEYTASNVTFTTVNITVSGYWTEDNQTAVGSGNVYSPSDLTDNALIRGDGGSRNAQTSTVLVSDDGEMTNPSQPAFRAYVNASQSNVTGDGTTYAITGAIWTEDYDVGNNFSNGTFTAPVDGKYQFNATVRIGGIASTHTRFYFYISGGGTTHTLFRGSATAMKDDASRVYVSGSALTDLSALDTVTISVYVGATSKVVDVLSNTEFSGSLVA